jgi:hypothetical protein
VAEGTDEGFDHEADDGAEAKGAVAVEKWGFHHGGEEAGMCEWGLACSGDERKNKLHE